MKKSKAQLSLEYLIILIIFVIFVSYFIIQLQLQKPLYIREVMAERLRSEIYQTSELLINDPGYPVDWNNDLSSVKRLGLSDANVNMANFLSIDKINEIGENCKPGYAKIKEWLGSEYDFSLYLIDKSDNNKFLIFCYPSEIKTKGFNATITRYVTFDKDASRHYGELVIYMW